MERAIFLDRDGTIIEDPGYLDSCDKVRFLPKVSEAIKRLNESGFKVIVITNQSGVARGYFTEETLKEINRYICQLLAEQGASIDRVYYCPHHIEGIIEAYRKECYCRKPNPGMVEKATRDFDIDLRKSFVIGDKSIDVETGYRTGCRTILLASQESPDKQGEMAVLPDHVAPNLYEAVKWLLEVS
jgi:D-glycero-D-manno-heptose 1,7-bisphosphate phosphatase